MVRIRRFGVMKTATVVAVMYMVIVAVIAIPVAAFVVVAGRDAGIGGVGGAAILFVAVIAALAYGVLGWIVTAIAAAIYNLVAGWTGGIEVELQAVAPPPPAPTWGAPPPAQPAPPSQPPAPPPPAQTGG